MSRVDSIKTPRGEVFIGEYKNGRVAAGLIWNTDVAKVLNGQFDRAQKMLDSEILRGCSTYVPFRTGMLQKSGTLGTVVGTGEIRYIAPYAKQQYYGKHGTKGQRGPYWFERWKNEHAAGLISRIKAKFKR